MNQIQFFLAFILAMRLFAGPLLMPDAPAFTGCGGATAPPDNPGYLQQVVDLVNQVRLENNLPPLKRVAELDNAAAYHATDMTQDNYFEHDTYDRVNGDLKYVCAWSSRIESYYPGWSSLAENIAAGYTTPASVMNGWMNSSGHKDNILSANNWEIGAGYSAAGDYWVQDFGQRAGVYPLVINREAETTSSPLVSIYVYGTWKEIRLRNESGVWSTWQSFKNSFSWNLDNKAGLHTVSAEMRNGTQTASASDTIVLDTASGTPALGNLPDLLVYTYSMADQRLYPEMQWLLPLNTGNSEPLSWSASLQSDWFIASQAQGVTPTSISVIPQGFNPTHTGTYTGTLTIAASTQGVAGSPQVIRLQLQVVEAPIHLLYLPLQQK